MFEKRKNSKKGNSCCLFPGENSRLAIPPREFFHEMTEFPSGGDSTRVGRAEKKTGKENKRMAGTKWSAGRAKNSPRLGETKILGILSASSPLRRLTHGATKVK